VTQFHSFTTAYRHLNKAQTRLIDFVVVTSSKFSVITTLIILLQVHSEFNTTKITNWCNFNVYWYERRKCGEMKIHGTGK